MWTDERGQILTAFGDTFGTGWTGFGSGSPVDPATVDWRSNTLARGLVAALMAAFHTHSTPDLSPPAAPPQPPARTSPAVPTAAAVTPHSVTLPTPGAVTPHPAATPTPPGQTRRPTTPRQQPTPYPHLRPLTRRQRVDAHPQSTRRGAVALVDHLLRQAERMCHRQVRTPPPSSSFAGFRYPPEVILVAVRWYLRYALSYRDVEELLAERGIIVDHVTVYRWVQRFTRC
jgi:hypothetical protein